MFPNKLNILDRLNRGSRQGLSIQKQTSKMRWRSWFEKHGLSSPEKKQNHFGLQDKFLEENDLIDFSKKYGVELARNQRRQ